MGPQEKKVCISVEKSYSFNVFVCNTKSFWGYLRIRWHPEITGKRDSLQDS